jgi:hypothetical protein
MDIIKSYFTVLLVFTSSILSAQTKRVSFGFSYATVTKNSQKIVEIREVIDGGDAKKQGLKSYDTITEINNKSTANLSPDEVTNEIIAAKEKGIIILKRKKDNKTLTIKTTEIETFKCLSKNCKDGLVKIKDVFNAYVYEGEFKNNKYNGKGSLTFVGVYKNNEQLFIIKQTGTYVDDKFVTGITYFNDGTFSGSLKYNKPDGIGIYTDTYGSVYKGTFSDGILTNGIITVNNNDNKTKSTIEVINSVRQKPVMIKDK